MLGLWTMGRSAELSDARRVDRDLTTESVAEVVGSVEILEDEKEITPERLSCILRGRGGGLQRATEGNIEICKVAAAACSMSESSLGRGANRTLLVLLSIPRTGLVGDKAGLGGSGMVGGGVDV